MSRASSNWLGAAGGMGFTVCAVISTAVVPQAPAFDAPASEIRAYVAGHRGGLAAAAVLSCVGAVLFMLFVAMVSHRMGEAEGAPGFLASAFLIAGTVTAAMGLLGGLLQSALLRRIEPAVDDSTLKAFHGLAQLVFFDGPSLPMAVALGAAAAAALRFGALPRATAWLAIGAAILGVSDVPWAIGARTDPLAAVSFVGFLLMNLWLLWISVATLRQRGRPRVAASQRAAGVTVTAR
jgi:hypothetical protein